MNNKNIQDVEVIEELIALYEKYGSLLTQTQKQAFHLRFFEDLSYQEIANVLVTTRSAAYDSVKKAIDKLEKINNKLKNNTL
ncbi:sigma factor-like helix-turn-helix DNA-binding protein [Mycoplasmopsis columbinasalis]|uniref:Sigma-70 factor-like HTH protein n=1 Tax=Mycoplasmopsis columbinasalis TaxID=114880 RepID=A0A449BA89_9BACT|nr:sigma factor-like helix-turn-helix DNA-binding protein [Mycoplasmopsis columbinasalis]VEU78095.1 sigma-70 factor-like HTH protein [Mycoplasmopsis columbinasalis]